MHIDSQFSFVWSAIIIGLLAILLLLQLYLIHRKNNIPLNRKWVKVGLNLMFFISLIFILLRPFFYREYVPKNILIHNAAVPLDFLADLQDSLNLEKIQTIDAYVGNADNVYLTGQPFTPSQLGKLQRANVTWIPYHEGADVTDIEWEGLLRQGQTQTIYGTYLPDENAIVYLKMDYQLLDSMQVGPFDPHFKLSAHVSSLGRNQLTIEANGKDLGQIRFFVIENNPIHYKMRFSYPDMEIRRLSEWLGEKGQGISATVQTSTSVLQQATNISQNDTLQFLITEPTFAGSEEVSLAIASGATVLFTNFSEVDKELLQINRALGTSWSVNRSHAEGNRIIEGPLTALPYRLLTQPQQWELFDAAVGYQRIGQAKVGVSLLEATFPIALEGDSVRYAAIWDKIFYSMRPAEGTNFQIPQPLYANLKSKEWNINSDQDINEVVFIGHDSIYLSPSPINLRSHTGFYQAPSPGWKTLADSLEIYIHGEDGEFQFVQHKNQILQFLDYQQDNIGKTESNFQKIQPSDWWWFTLVLISATMLWMEPRVGL